MDSSQSMESKRSACNARVNFDDSASTVHTIDRIPHELRCELWWTLAEYNMIKLRNKLVVKGAKKGSYDEVLHVDSTRGLEKLLSYEHHVRFRNSQFAVFNEQRNQLVAGFCSPESLALGYALHCKSSHRLAYERGLRDARDAYGCSLSLLATPTLVDGPLTKRSRFLQAVRKGLARHAGAFR